MAYLYRLIVFLIISLPNFVNAQSAPVGAIDLAGWIKGADGTYTKAFGGSSVTLTSPPSGITTTSTALVKIENVVARLPGVDLYCVLGGTDIATQTSID